MCYPDGSPEAVGYQDTICSLDAGAIPQTYDCGHDDYFNPAPAPGSYLDLHWNVYRSDFLGNCGTLGMACGAGVVPAPPVNTEPPTLTGLAALGAPLTAGAGTWLNAPASYALRWQRATDAGWVNIAGASGSSYVPTDADVGATLRVTVTATNADGAAIAASPATGPIAGYSAPLPGVQTTTPKAPATLAARPPEHLAARPDAPCQGHARGAHRRGPRRARGAHRRGQGRGDARHLAPAPVRRPQEGRRCAARCPSACARARAVSDCPPPRCSSAPRAAP